MIKTVSTGILSALVLACFVNTPTLANTERGVHTQSQAQHTLNVSDYVAQVNRATWQMHMPADKILTAKIQILLDRHHVSAGTIDGGWGQTSQNALKGFQLLKGLPATGMMDKATWQALTDGMTEDSLFMSYTISKDDVSYEFFKTPTGAEARSKLKHLPYESIEEMLAERFHMSVSYLKKLNPKPFTVGEKLIVVNTQKPLNAAITKVVIDQNIKTLYAYQDDTLVATYPVSLNTTSKTPVGVFSVTKKVNSPQYKAVIHRGTSKQRTYILPSGANNPMGVAWLSLDVEGCGIHGMPAPEAIHLPLPVGCIGLINWDMAELFDNIVMNATVEIRPPHY